MTTDTSGADRYVRYEPSGDLAQVVLDRPDKLNALSSAALEQLAAAVEAANRDPNVRVIVLSGAGGHFCAGADLDEVEGHLARPPAFDDFLTRWHEVFAIVERSDVPTIAAVHGVALAGGFELLQVCDVVVADPDARIGDQHAKFGLFPGGGSSQRLPRLIGRRQAMWLLLSGEWLPAEEAQAHGLVTVVSEPGRALEKSLELAALLAKRSPLASAAIKRAVRLGEGLPLQAALALEQGVATAHMQTPDALEGLAAFKERRSPDFPGQRTSATEDAP